MAFPAFTPDGTRLVSCGRAGRVIVWDWKNVKKLKTWHFPFDVRSVAVSPDGRYVAMANYHENGTVYVLRSE